MNDRRTTILVIAVITLTLSGCGRVSGGGEAPDLPASVTPLWTRTSFAAGTPPKELDTAGTSVNCWQAAYSGPGSATAWVCRYPVPTGAFEALQRTRAAANTVKFQEGDAFVFIQWDKATRDEVTTLVHAIQRALKK